jgi:hypothetical protein
VSLSAAENRLSWFNMKTQQNNTAQTRQLPYKHHSLIQAWKYMNGLFQQLLHEENFHTAVFFRTGKNILRYLHNYLVKQKE